MQAEAMDGINMLCWWVIHVIRSVPTDAMESLREGSLWRGGMGGETRWAVRARERSARNLLRGIWQFSRQTSHSSPSSPFRIWGLRRLCRSSKGRLKKIINILSDWLMYRKPATLRQFFLRRGLFSCQIMLEQRQHWPSLGKVVIYNSKRALPRLWVPPRFFGSVEY